MSVYNGAQFLDQAINSIRDQTYKNFEFIIVDDGSTDATSDILARQSLTDSRIRIISQANHGLIDSLNFAFGAATGAYIARMDADDRARPERFEMQLDFLSSHPAVALVGGSFDIIDAESRLIRTVRLPELSDELRNYMRLYGNAIAHPTVMFRRQILHQVKGFRKAYLHAEDYDFWLRIMEQFDVANLRAVLIDYRRHERSIGSTKNAKQEALSALCARTTARLRLQGFPDPTDGADRVTETLLRNLGVTQAAIDAAIFATLVYHTEDAISCGVCSAAAEFVRTAKPYVTAEELTRVSLELNRKAAAAPASCFEKSKHRTALLTADPTAYWELFQRAMKRSNVQGHPNHEVTSSRDETPLFSVLIPAYNHAKYVKQAVISALSSPLVSEVLLVDDGSTDDTASILAELAARNPGRVRDLTTKGEVNRGAHVRLNQLVEAARCSWLAVLNSDDVFVHGRFEAIVSDEHFSQSDLIFGNLLLIDGKGRLSGAKRGPLDPGLPYPREFDLEQILRSGNLLDLLAHQNFIATTSNMVFRKDLHARIGGFAAFRYVHDWDFALRATVLGRFSYMRRYITAYRRHTSNTIGEGSAAVNTESARLFDRLLTDFPQLLERPYFTFGLRQNANLSRIQNHVVKNAEARARVGIPQHL